MADIQFRTLNQLVQVQLDYIAANAPVALSTPLGPFVTAVVYAVALVGLTLQRLIQLVLSASRLTTSSGEDVDSFVGDFGLARLPGAQATGDVILSRNVTAVSQILVPVGTVVQTSDNPPVRFAVVGDTSNAAFSVARNAYLLNTGSTAVVVPVQALEPGILGNVFAGEINRIGSTLPGIDKVANDEAFVTGTDPETDEALKLRFALFIQSLSKATKGAIASAVANVQPGIVFRIYENLALDTTVDNGQFVVTVDDGTGAPSPALITAAENAVDLVRPISVRAIVSGPTITLQAASFLIIAYDAQIVPDVVALSEVVQSAIVNYINRTSFIETVQLSQIYKAIWESVSPGDAIQTIIAPNPPSTGSVLFVASTEGMAIGQLVEISGRVTASGALPKIVSVETNSSIVISPPLVSAPIPNDIVTTFALRPGQITNVNTLAIGALISTQKTDDSQISGGNIGSAINGNFAGVTGIATIIYVESLGDIVVNDTVLLAGYQPDPDTLPPSDQNMRVFVVATATSPPRVIVQPPLGKLNADGSWDDIQPAPGTGAIVPDGTDLYRCFFAAALLDPPTNSLTAVTRTKAPQIVVYMAPLVSS